MKHYRLIIQPAAEANIEEAYHWIAEQSPEGAAHWFHAMRQAIESLATMPQRCGRAPESPAFGYDIRQLIVGSYRVLFAIQDDRVIILHVRHGSRRWMQPDEVVPPQAPDG